MPVTDDLGVDRLGKEDAAKQEEKRQRCIALFVNPPVAPVTRNEKKEDKPRRTLDAARRAKQAIQNPPLLSLTEPVLVWLSRG